MATKSTQTAAKTAIITMPLPQLTRDCISCTIVKMSRLIWAKLSSKTVLKHDKCQYLQLFCKKKISYNTL